MKIWLSGSCLCSRRFIVYNEASVYDHKETNPYTTKLLKVAFGEAYGHEFFCMGVIREYGETIYEFDSDREYMAEDLREIMRLADEAKSNTEWE